VRHGITGLVVPARNAKALKQAIETLLCNPGLRADMGHAGRKWMQRDFHPEAIWHAHTEMYREMLKEGLWRKRPQRGGFAKRAFDLFTAAVALIVLSPVIATIAMVVRMFLGSPVLFRQVRPGYKARPFTCLKFRTMTDKRDVNGQLLSDAERLTPLGRFLRSTSLDELPELVNVIRGEMSLVGPRPLLMKYLERYTQEQTRRHDVKPGITGWAQVNGRNAASWDKKFAWDVWYVDNCSFWLDMKILVLTLSKTLKREGISQPGHATMQEFRGAGVRRTET
jgi:lipopolysaccharide/colanic/teichoic acid biosynthesis glycosyltransferase